MSAGDRRPLTSCGLRGRGSLRCACRAAARGRESIRSGRLRWSYAGEARCGREHAHASTGRPCARAEQDGFEAVLGEPQRRRPGTPATASRSGAGSGRPSARSAAAARDPQPVPDAPRTATGRAAVARPAARRAPPALDTTQPRPCAGSSARYSAGELLAALPAAARCGVTGHRWRRRRGTCRYHVPVTGTVGCPRWHRV